MDAFILYQLKSAAILTLFYTSYYFLLKNETFHVLNRYYLLIGIIIALISPLIIINTYTYITTTSTGLAPITGQFTIDKNTLKWQDIVLACYFIGVFFLSLRLVLRVFNLIQILKSNSPKRINGFKMVETNTNTSPFSFFNYIVYNPDSYSKKELEFILKHEMAHSQQFHSFDIILAELFIIFQWFNPLAWSYKDKISQNIEYLADKAITIHTETKVPYQHLLLKTTIPLYYSQLTNNFYNSLLKKRIIMINKTSSKKQNLIKYITILPLLTFFLFSFNTKDVIVLKTENTVSVTSEKKPLYYVDGKLTSAKDLKKMETNSIAHIEVLKGEKAIEKYGEKGKNGVIIITTKAFSNKKTSSNSNSSDGITIKNKKDNSTFKITEISNNTSAKKTANSPLYIVDGKEVSNVSIDNDNIAKINVYKGQEAIKKYGEKGKNGVIVITTKN